MPRSGSNEQLTPHSTPERQYDTMAESNVPRVVIAEPGRSGPQERPVEERDESGVAEETGIDADRLLIYGSKQIIRLFVPVSVCMCVVVLMISFMNFFTRRDGYLIYTPFHTENADVGRKLWENLSNALIFIGIIVVITILIVLLYKYRCYKVIYGWLLMTSVMMLFFFSFFMFKSLCNTFSVFADYITFIILLWNFGIVGMIVIYWNAPLILQQAYLLVISAEMAALFIKYFPDWTVWFLLALLAVWDLIAVLCPKGPLRVLVEMASERQETLMPAMIYSTTAVWALMVHRDSEDQQPVADDGGFPDHSPNEERAAQVSAAAEPDDLDASVSSTRARSAVSALGAAPANGSTSPQLANEREPLAASRTARNLRDIQEEVLARDDRGVKLGLGDFVFYSVLVGKASTSGDWNTTLACFVAILIGMCFTLLLLAIRGHALPALPISIFFGLVFFFCTNRIITPFSTELAAQQVFI